MEQSIDVHVRGALSSKPAACRCVVDQWDGQTDGRTKGRTYRRSSVSQTLLCRILFGRRQQFSTCATAAAASDVIEMNVSTVDVIMTSADVIHQDGDHYSIWTTRMNEVHLLPFTIVQISLAKNFRLKYKTIR